MMVTTVQNILDAKKSTQVLTVSPDDSVQSAVEIMASEHISSLPVMDDDNLVGIISERDYIRKAAPNRRLPWKILIKDLMTREVVHVTPEETINNCMTIMTSRRIRHLPVLRDSTLVGIVSITDLIRTLRQGRSQC